MNANSRLGRRLAPLALWLEKATARLQPTEEQKAALFAKMPTLSHDGVDYDTKTLESQLQSLGGDGKVRAHIKANPNSVLAAYDKARSNHMRGMSQKTVRTPITERLSDERVQLTGSGWASVADGEDGVQLPHQPVGDPYKFVSGDPLSLANISVTRNRALRDAKHDAVLTEGHLKQLNQGVDSLKLQGHLDTGRENYMRVFNAAHAIRMKNNPKAQTTVGGLPEPMLPIFKDAAKALGPEGKALHDLFDHAQGVFQKYPMPAVKRGRENAGRRGYNDLVTIMDKPKRVNTNASRKEAAKVKAKVEALQASPVDPAVALAREEMAKYKARMAAKKAEAESHKSLNSLYTPLYFMMSSLRTD